MASEEQKKLNRYRLVSLSFASFAMATWQMLGESSFLLTSLVGDNTLNVMEKEMGLEIAGNSPKEVMMEISRILIDEFGFADDIEVTGDDEKIITLKVKQCSYRDYTDFLMKNGVEKPFLCPVLTTCQAGLKRMGYKMKDNIEEWREERGSIITFERIA